jgi:16S rRNA (guanine527-N7)-methyltransferase
LITTEAEARAYVAQRCDGEGLDRLDRLVELLKVENTRQNLVSAASLDSIWLRHIADSAQLLDHVPRETGTWLDLGTGAGFPGMVIAALRPDSRTVVVESRKRRIEWLHALVDALDLQNCSVIGSRLEVTEPFPASVISARAFAPLDKLLSLAERFSTSDTVWLLPKGRSAAQEVAGLPKSLRSTFHVEQSVTDADSGIVVGRIAKERRA